MLRLKILENRTTIPAESNLDLHLHADIPPTLDFSQDENYRNNPSYFSA